MTADDSHNEKITTEGLFTYQLERSLDFSFSNWNTSNSERCYCREKRRFLWMWSHLLKKSLMENFIFCAVIYWHLYLTYFLRKISPIVMLVMESFHLKYLFVTKQWTLQCFLSIWYNKFITSWTRVQYLSSILVHDMINFLYYEH